MLKTIRQNSTVTKTLLQRSGVQKILRAASEVTTKLRQESNALFISRDSSAPFDAVDFDGVNDYLLRSADLTGLADGKSGIVSFWYRIDGGDGTARRILSNTAARLTIASAPSDRVFFTGLNASNAAILEMYTAPLTTSATWLHLLMSWDLATGATHLYVNDVSDKTVATLIDDTIDYTAAAWAVGALVTGANKLNGGLAEVYFAPNQYLDFSIVGNRRKFISASGKPVNLGVSAAVPTGVAPAIYLSLNDGGVADNFATNHGTGGDFSLVGSLDIASTSPSD